MNVQLIETQVRKALNLSHSKVPDLAIILGSGLTCDLPFVKVCTLKYADIEGFPQVQVKGHKGIITCGEMANGAQVIVFAGRFHLYEGYSPSEVQTIVQLVHSLGINNLLITNAAGGISDNLQIADLMLIEGVRNYQNNGILLSERGLLEGLTQSSLKVTSNLSEHIASQGLKKGIYAAVLGPNYETQAEINLFHHQGCAAVGMSTYLELKLALELGLNVAAISVITNSWSSEAAPLHNEVLNNSRSAQSRLSELLQSSLEFIIAQKNYKFNPSTN